MSEESERQQRAGLGRLLAGPAVVALSALAAVTLTLDPADCRPVLPQGPGVTLDETFNIQMGVFFTEAAKSYGLGLLNPASLSEIFSVEGYNPDHPPLARFWLGLSHDFVEWVAPAQDIAPDPGSSLKTVTASARFGSAVAFALTVFLVGAMAARWRGAFAGTSAAVSLVLMPRVFGHAHLAALESVTGLFWTASVLMTAQLWCRVRSRAAARVAGATNAMNAQPSDRAAVLTGLLFGLTFLCKMQAVLLPPLLTVWAFYHWRLSAFRPLAMAGLMTGTVFLLGWPWLWLDLPGHLVDYFSSATSRTALHCWYFGTQFVDKAVPWHYPFVMSLLTVPLGLLLLGGVGVASLRSQFRADPRWSLVLGAVAAPLILFSVPGIAVYDGVRLFLVAFPAAAIFCGVGADAASKWLARFRSRRQALAIVSLFLACQAVGVVQLAPYWLSYYNLSIGGLSGAERAGLEVSYWSESITREFLTSVVEFAPPGSVIEVTPVMHPSQPREMWRQSPLLRRHGVTLIAYGTRPVHSEFLITFRRRADVLSPEELETKGWRERHSLSRSGVKLATLWQRR